MQSLKLALAGLCLATLPLVAKDTVLLLGDSMMKAIAPTLEQKFAAAGCDVKTSAAIGTGLARLDLYDWMAKAAELPKAEIAIVMMGANDNQPMRATGGIVKHGTPEWQKEYTTRVANFVAALQKNGIKHVLWVELPAMRDDKLNADCLGINAAAKAGVSQCGQTWYETRALLSKTPDGAYSAYIIQASGMPLHIRAEDGVHINRKGADLLADKLVPAVKAKLK
jgi:hypothetical protein